MGLALAMHGAAAGAIALGGGGGGASVGAPAGTVEVEVFVPELVPTVLPEGPSTQPLAAAAPHARPAPVHAAAAPTADAVGPVLTADPAPTAPPRFTIAFATTAAPVNQPAADDGVAPSAAQLVAPPIVDASRVTTSARLLQSVTPAYPAAARELGLEAVTKLEIVVDEDGRVVHASFLERAGDGFDEAALAALRDYRFSPARVGDRVVRVRMPWSVEFRLR